MKAKVYTPMTLDEAIESIPFGFYHYRLFVLCGLNFMLDAFEISSLSFISVCAGVEWGLGDSAKATLSGVVFAGIVIGSIFWGWLADKYGRRPAYIYSCMLVTFGGMLSSVASTFEWLIFFRALTGIGIGGSSVPFDLLAEFLPSKKRGAWLNYTNLFWTGGSLAVASLAWAILPSYGWRAYAFSAAVPVLFITIIAFIWLPESPRFHLVKGRPGEAARVLQEAAAINGVPHREILLVDLTPTPTPTPISPIDPTSQGHAHAHTQAHAHRGAHSHVHVHAQTHAQVGVTAEASYLDLIRSAKLRRIVLPLWTVWGIFGFTYYALILFVNRRYTAQEAGRHSFNQCDFNYSAIFVNAAFETVGLLCSGMLIDVLGRIKTQSVFYILAGIAAFAMGFDSSSATLMFFSVLGRMSIMASSVSFCCFTLYSSSSTP
jgi:MFS family permease